MYERRYGYPRSDVESVMNHYGVSYSEAVKGLELGKYPLPPRGTRLRSSNNPVNWTVLIAGGAAVLSGVAMLYEAFKGR